MLRNEIKTIRLALPLRMGSVNCFLIETDSGYVMVDTGGSNSRKALVRELESAGCKPGLLKLIVLTHGDFDHTGNARFLKQAFGGKIAMHPDDAGMVERGDMFVNRKSPNRFVRWMILIFTGFSKAERFTPDLLLKDGDDLSEYGLDARVLSLPGHSKGSIGILTREAALFCGDLLENTHQPAPGSIVDDQEAANASLQRLRGMGIVMVYPGHGGPFPMERLFQ